MSPFQLGRSVACSTALWLIVIATAWPAPCPGADLPQDTRINFHFWHRKGSSLNTSEYDPKFPHRYEYMEFDEWSLNGWAPKKIDAVLEMTPKTQEALKYVSDVRVTVTLRVGPLKVDPATRLTDYAALEAEAIWLPAYVAKRIPRRSSAAGRLILLKDFDLEAVHTDLWRRGLWPVELKVDVVLEPLQSDRLHTAVISRSLRIEPGD